MRQSAAVMALFVLVASLHGQNGPEAPKIKLYSSAGLPQGVDDVPPSNLPPLVPAALGAPSTPAAAAASGSDKAPPIDCDPACTPGDCKLPARWTVRHDIGDGVGFTRGFTYLEVFAPLWQPQPDALWFGDVRVVNFDDASRWEFNAGGGYRAHAPGIDAVLGGNLFYDGRHTDNNFFHQIGAGAEAIFPRCEFRCNGYIIVGPDEKFARTSGLFSVPLGDQILIAQILTHEVAMGGVDFEGGVMLPALGAVAPRAFVGGYHYSAHRMPSVNGVRGRLEAWLGSGVTLHFAIQHDDVFDTTVSGGIALHGGGTDVKRNRRDDSPRGVDERLGQRVVRDVNIVIAQRQTLVGTLQPAPVKTPPKQKPPKGGGNEEPPPPGGSGEEPPEEEEPDCDPPPPPPPPLSCIPYPKPPRCDPPPPCIPYPSPPQCDPPPRCIPWPPVIFHHHGHHHHHHHGHHHGKGHFHHHGKGHGHDHHDHHGHHHHGKGHYKHLCQVWPICARTSWCDDD